jgi:hypothetical protein
MTSSTLKAIKAMVNELNEDDMCAVIDHIAKRVWIPTYVPRERFDVPVDAYNTIINDNNLNAKINDFVCYLLQNKFDNQEEDDKVTEDTDNQSVDIPDEEVVAEIEVVNDESMTVEGLIERMCTITEIIDIEK